MHPHHHGRGGHEYEAVAESAAGASLAGGLLLLTLVLLALTALYLWRKGLLGRPVAAVAGPEEEAKRVLAERFARGEITSDDFMERAAILNWTPGVTSVPQPPRLRRP